MFIPTRIRPIIEISTGFPFREEQKDPPFAKGAKGRAPEPSLRLAAARIVVGYTLGGRLGGTILFQTLIETRRLL
jgi:hypothetical protein